MNWVCDLFEDATFPYPELLRCSFPWEILSLLDDFLKQHTFCGILGTVEKGVFLKNEDLIEIADGAYVESGAYITGPCIIGPGSEVRHGAYIRGGVVTGEKCVIGHCTEVKQAYLGHGVKAGHFAYIGDTVLASGVLLGAGVRCANFRLDGKNITATYKGERMHTQKRKVGAFLGENVGVGCNVVLNPGTCLARGTYIYPKSY